MADESSKLIVITILPGSRLLTMAGPADVFSFAQLMLEEEHGKGFKGYEVVIASATADKEIKLNSSARLIAATSLLEMDRPIDTLILIGMRLEEQPDTDNFYHWLHLNAPHIRRVAGVCVATFVLAKAGLLKHKRATTHWERTEDLQRRYPDVLVDTTPFFIKDGNIYTAGGVTSGMDLSLAMVEEDYGRETALRVARKLVIHLKRPGNQKQFGGLLPDYELTSPLLAQLRPWMLEHLHENINVDEMAAFSHMSARNFARVFLRETTFTPAKFLEKLRVEIARNYLENSSLSLEEIALKCGLGGLVSMRRVFLRHLEISPGTYRSTFRTALHTD
ncbi:GlxA family transcriptional regulator [Chitinophaga sp. Cy-1792]|uniref:GlxA family transcriptional regulator n=1 Tax=Chitinophaga sp. Cy-1792 TaxID=2608339 RepID=UPI0014216510|nr:helix-turn-helix domain-containing protein [Chitinophaga sp. Cy-1792]NIG54163.1 helix-turn-helix domain-containing protein [Chitinophaga sp. Cy-1792]